MQEFPNNPIFEKFTEVVDQRTALIGMMATASAANRRIISTAIDRADDKISEMQRDPELQDIFYGITGPITKRVDELVALRDITAGLGVEDDIDRALQGVAEEIQSDKVLRIAFMFSSCPPNILKGVVQRDEEPINLEPLLSTDGDEAASEEKRVLDHIADPPTQPEEATVIEYGLPLSPPSCALVAELANHFSEQLEDIGASPFSGEQFDLLIESVEREAMLRTIEDAGDQKTARRNAVSKLQEFFADHVQAFDAIDQIKTESPYKAFLKWLHENNIDEVWQLLTTLAGSSRASEITVDMDYRTGGTVVGIRRVIMAPTDSGDRDLAEPKKPKRTEFSIDDSEPSISRAKSTQTNGAGTLLVEPKRVETVNLPTQHTAAEIRPDDKKSSEIEKPDWEEDLKRIVGQTICLLESQGLLDERAPIPWNTLRIKSDSGLISKTLLDRMAQAGIKIPGYTKGGRANRSLNALDVSTNLVVAMSLFNSHRHLLGKGPKQRDSLRIIDECLSAYFNQKNRSSN